MGLRLIFLTGARSDYGLARALLQAIDADPRIELAVVPHGMHHLELYGRTVQEIRQDGFEIVQEVETEGADDDVKAYEFTSTVRQLHDLLYREQPRAVLIVGDRLEAYGAALAAHFAGISVIHSGGGHITTGAVDNVYRFNISNLATLHLVTSRHAYERLRSAPLVDEEYVHFVGSVAVDQIKAFQRAPEQIASYVRGLAGRPFALMTFHPVTSADDPTPELLQDAVDHILQKEYDVLITYPNNDAGSKRLMEVIERSRERSGVHAVESLGSRGYYAALQHCRFIIGNSSSGLMEAPYFNKPVLNVGARQDGREKDTGVFDVPADRSAVLQALEEGFACDWPPVPCSNLYGAGHSVEKAHEAIATFMKKVHSVPGKPSVIREISSSNTPLGNSISERAKR